MNTKRIETELKVDFELILNWTRPEFVDHLKYRLVGNVDEIETLHYEPRRIENGQVVLFIRAFRKTALAEDASADDVKSSVLDSGAVLPTVGVVHDYTWKKKDGEWAGGPVRGAR